MFSNFWHPRVVSLWVGIFLATGGVAGPGFSHGAVPQAEAPSTFSGQVVELAPQIVGPGEVILEVDVKLPAGWQLTPEAPAVVRVTARDAGVVSVPAQAAAGWRTPRFPLSLPLGVHAGHTELSLDLLLSFCRIDGKGLCLLREVRLKLPVTVSPAAPGRQLKGAYQFSPP